MEYNFGMGKAAGSKFGMKKVWETILGVFGLWEKPTRSWNNLQTLIPNTQGKEKNPNWIEF